MTLSDSHQHRRPATTLRPLPPYQMGLPRLPASPFQRAVPIIPADRDRCICRLLPCPARPSPLLGRVGIRIITFETCSGYRGRYRVAGQVPGSPSLICLSMPARSLRSRTRRAFARGPAALLDLRSARRPWGIRSGRRNDQSPIEQRNWETLEAQAGMAIAGSNGLPVFSTPKQITSSLRIAATTICLGLRRPACFRRATSAMMAGL
jgi:hypothetical protein